MGLRSLRLAAFFIHTCLDNLLFATSTFSVPMDGWNCNFECSRTSSSFREQSFCLSDVQAVHRILYFNRLDLKELNYHKSQNSDYLRLVRTILVGSRKAFLAHGCWVAPSLVQDSPNILQALLIGTEASLHRKYKNKTYI